MARKFWPGETAVGKRVKLSSTPERSPWITVIGVVGDVRHFGLDIDRGRRFTGRTRVNPLGAPILVIRTRTDRGAAARAR